jgi:hypothetical protein
LFLSKRRRNIGRFLGANGASDLTARRFLAIRRVF